MTDNSWVEAVCHVSWMRSERWTITQAIDAAVAAGAPRTLYYVVWGWDGVEEAFARIHRAMPLQIERYRVAA